MSDGRSANTEDIPMKTLSDAYTELQEAAALLMAQYEIEEDEHGFPFNFGLREAHRKLKKVLRSHSGNFDD